MDIKVLSKDLSALQTRLEKYEDAVMEGTKGPQDVQKHNLDMLAYYRGETAKVRAKYLDLISVVREEIGRS